MMDVEVPMSSSTNRLPKWISRTFTFRSVLSTVATGLLVMMILTSEGRHKPKCSKTVGMAPEYLVASHLEHLPRCRLWVYVIMQPEGVSIGLP